VRQKHNARVYGLCIIDSHRTHSWWYLYGYAIHVCAILASFGVCMGCVRGFVNLISFLFLSIPTTRREGHPHSLFRLNKIV
jgi:hypothetical protein